MWHKRFVVCGCAVVSMVLVAHGDCGHGEADIHAHGFWIGENVEDFHDFDRPLCHAIGGVLIREQAATVTDFGCGASAHYVHGLLKQGVTIEGYDGTPETPILSKGVAQALDLAEPQDLGKEFDWVISLETGEHIPPQYETIFIENLVRHAKRGLILSWAIKGQPGHGHFNCRNNNYIIERLSERGFTLDAPNSVVLRRSSTRWWFKNTIMVFRRNKS